MSTLLRFKPRGRRSVNSLQAEGSLFAFRINTAALEGAGIFQTDEAVAYFSHTFEDGDLVLVSYGTRMYVRYASRTPEGLVTLASRNDAYPPITGHPADFQLIGVLIGLSREL